MVLAAFVLIDM